jgi:hypothetical protein
MTNSVSGRAKPPLVLSPRQEELIRAIQALPPDARHEVVVLCRGSEPWEIQRIVERRRIGELKAGDA